MNNPIVLTITTGQEIWNKGMTKVQAFIPNQSLVKTGQTALPVGAAFKLPSSLAAIVASEQKINAIRGEPEAHCGSWQKRTIQFQEGMVIQLFGMRRLRWNSISSSANAYLRFRADAADRSLIIKTLQVAGQSELQEVEVRGRFDILTPEEAAARHGIATNPMFVRSFSPTSFQFLFTERIHSEATRAPERAVTTTIRSEQTGTAVEVEVVRQTTLLEF